MMQNNNALLTACSSFAITNIDDLFILVTFFAEAASGKTMTPLTIAAGQYVGFTAILVISMTGYAAAVVLPTEPIGFLGLLPILLGFWSLLDLFLKDEDDEDNVAVGIGGWRAVRKVGLITIVNGGDNIGTYIPLFAQARKADMAVYLVTYYVLLGVLCFVAWLVMQQKDILAVAEKYAGVVVPFLYMGLGVFIIVDSECYPWLGHAVDTETELSGLAVMAVSTSVLLVAAMAAMAWFKLRKGRGDGSAETGYTEVAREENEEGSGRRGDVRKIVLPWVLALDI